MMCVCMCTHVCVRKCLDACKRMLHMCIVCIWDNGSSLRQYYIYHGGSRYVDLGLQTHRVKCRVHENFKYVKHLSCETTLSCHTQSLSSHRLQADLDCREEHSVREVPHTSYQPAGETLCSHFLCAHKRPVRSFEMVTGVGT